MTFSIEFNYLTMTRVSIETALSSPQFSVGHLGLIINWLIVFLVLELGVGIGVGVGVGVGVVGDVGDIVDVVDVVYVDDIGGN